MSSEWDFFSYFRLIFGGKTSSIGYQFIDVSPPVLSIEIEWSCPLMWCRHCGHIMQLVVTVVLSDGAICLCVPSFKSENIFLNSIFRARFRFFFIEPNLHPCHIHYNVLYRETAGRAAAGQGEAEGEETSGGPEGHLGRPLRASC